MSQSSRRFSWQGKTTFETKADLNPLQDAINTFNSVMSFSAHFEDVFKTPASDLGVASPVLRRTRQVWKGGRKSNSGDTQMVARRRRRERDSGVGSGGQRALPSLDSQRSRISLSSASVWQNGSQQTGGNTRNATKLGLKAMFIHVYTCLHMFANVYTCLHMFTHVYTCLQMFANVFIVYKCFHCLKMPARFSIRTSRQYCESSRRSSGIVRDRRRIRMVVGRACGCFCRLVDCIRRHRRVKD